MSVDNQKIYQSLLELKIFNQSILDNALAEAESSKISLEEVVLAKDIISDENLGLLMADIYGQKYVNLNEISLDKKTLEIIPENWAKKWNVIAFKTDKKGLCLTTCDPSNPELLYWLDKKFGSQYLLHYSTKRNIKMAFFNYQDNISQVFEQLLKKNITTSTQDSQDSTPIIELLNTILTYAYQSKASDIHLEPNKKNITVRLRIDGILSDIVSLPFELHDRLISRLKVIAGLRTDEHQSAQDGKFVYSVENGLEDLDIRLSIIPTIVGEKAVMRLLSETARQFALSNLGINDSDLEKVKKAYSKPFGMILSTGPTGSGKTTSLYGIIKILNSRNVNIMTIEDPVEYEVRGVNSIQVNPKTNLTFAEGLRSIVRQDPNIIMVGEIRDPETASIAINSAMTGHLVLSTLHTNDAATALIRFNEMGVDPFLIASSVNLIIGQRLVRKICGSCKISQDVSLDYLKKNLPSDLWSKIPKSKNKKIKIYKGNGCPVCHHSGYRDRVGIFEVLEIDDKIRQAINLRKDASDIKKIAVSNGMTTMIDDGFRKVLSVDTTIDELIRVIRQ